MSICRRFKGQLEHMSDKVEFKLEQFYLKTLYFDCNLYLNYCFTGIFPCYLWMSCVTPIVIWGASKIGKTGTDIWWTGLERQLSYRYPRTFVVYVSVFCVRAAPVISMF